MISNEGFEIATLGAGCFWCVEAVFQDLKGVQSVVSGYCNGQVENPTYKEVCSGTTGHVEAVQVSFDPSIISFEKILEVHLSNAVSDELGIAYIARGLTFGEAEPEGSEELSLRKLPFADLYQMVLDGTISDALSFCAVMKAAKIL
jgi:hypothetical protein